MVRAGETPAPPFYIAKAEMDRRDVQADELANECFYVRLEMQTLQDTHAADMAKLKTDEAAARKELEAKMRTELEAKMRTELEEHKKRIDDMMRIAMAKIEGRRDP